tara:strand:- start:218 stop:613 length:396 start_codon:yes stop_codon:yes gene_type:complete
MSGIKRGRKALNKTQFNIRLAPEYASVLEEKEGFAIFKAWIRHREVRLPDAKKHGKNAGMSISGIITRMLDDQMEFIVDTHPEWVLDCAQSHYVHPKWFNKALNNATVDDMSKGMYGKTPKEMVEEYHKRG